jgi:hypothetical protein
MTLPALVFGFMVSTLMGAGFHLWKDGGIGRLVLYLILAWVGFWAGHLLGSRFNLDFASIGPLHFGVAIVMAALALFAGYWLSLINREEQP